MSILKGSKHWVSGWLGVGLDDDKKRRRSKYQLPCSITFHKSKVHPLAAVSTTESKFRTYPHFQKTVL